MKTTSEAMENPKISTKEDLAQASRGRSAEPADLV